MITGKVKGLDEFRAAHDKSTIVPAKIKQALADLGSGWEYENEFMKRLAGVGNKDFANFREQFEDFQIHVGAKKRVWAGTKAFAATLRATQF